MQHNNSHSNGKQKQNVRLEYLCINDTQNISTNTELLQNKSYITFAANPYRILSTLNQSKLHQKIMFRGISLILYNLEYNLSEAFA